VPSHLSAAAFAIASFHYAAATLSATITPDIFDTLSMPSAFRRQDDYLFQFRYFHYYAIARCHYY
jgi:hypothetical protein